MTTLRVPKVTASVSPLGRLVPQACEIRYRDPDDLPGEERTRYLSTGLGWAGEVWRLTAHGCEVIEVTGRRGKRSWRLYPEGGAK